MEINLKEVLTRYKIINSEIIVALKNDEIDEIESLINARQTIIDEIDSGSFIKEDFKAIAEELELVEDEELIQKTLKYKKAEIGLKISRISQNKNAKKNYNKKFDVDSLYFNKKI